jgi:hypothetical protein
MVHADTVSAFILDTQIAIFDDARHDLQLSLAAIARKARLPIGTVNAWAQGRNALSLWGVKKLLRVEGMGKLLSRLFEPEDYALIGVTAGIDHDEASAAMRDFIDAKERFHHPQSEAGREIGPGEDKTLRSKFAVVAGGRQ